MDSYVCSLRKLYRTQMPPSPQGVLRIAIAHSVKFVQTCRVGITYIGWDVDLKRNPLPYSLLLTYWDQNLKYDATLKVAI